MQGEEEDEAEVVLPCPLFSSDSDTDTDTDTSKKGGRNVCWDGCGRPCSVCICPYLPPSPIPTFTSILILHHPHELKHNVKLSTLPPITRCLLNSHLLPGRKLRPNSHPLLLRQNLTPLFLYPSPSPSDDIVRWTEETPRGERDNPLLIVFDGTWRQAREMVAASRKFLSGIGARQVSVGRCEVGTEGPSTFESELVMRKEPFVGCVSTMEAVARALRVLEPEGVGVEVEERLLSVLRAMVGFQARHLRPMEPRRKMRKKKMTMGDQEMATEDSCT